MRHILRECLRARCFRASLLLHTTCNHSCCNWCVSRMSTKHKQQKKALKLKNTFQEPKNKNRFSVLYPGRRSPYTCSVLPGTHRCCCWHSFYTCSSAVAAQFPALFLTEAVWTNAALQRIFSRLPSTKGEPFKSFFFHHLDAAALGFSRPWTRIKLGCVESVSISQHVQKPPVQSWANRPMGEKKNQPDFVGHGWGSGHPTLSKGGQGEVGTSAISDRGCISLVSLTMKPQDLI